MQAFFYLHKYTLRTKIFGGKSFGGKTLAEKLSDKLLNFGGKTFGQTFLSGKTLGQVFLTIFYLRLKGNDSEGCRKMFFYSRYLFFKQKTVSKQKKYVNAQMCLYNVC